MVLFSLRKRYPQIIHNDPITETSILVMSMTVAGDFFIRIFGEDAHWKYPSIFARVIIHGSVGFIQHQRRRYHFILNPLIANVYPFFLLLRDPFYVCLFSDFFRGPRFIYDNVIRFTSIPIFRNLFIGLLLVMKHLRVSRRLSCMHSHLQDIAGHK